MVIRAGERGSSGSRPGGVDAPAASDGAAEPRPAGVLGEGADGLLPWLGTPLAQALARARGQAILVEAPAGCGQFELAVALAQSGLCEAAPPDRPGGQEAPLARACGACASCRLVAAQTHPDLLILLPEALRDRLGWDAEAADAAGEGGEGATGAAGVRRKPSREIKVDAIRAAVAFATVTSARGRGKAVVIHPAERLNAIAANTLLKTLEEPAGNTRFILATGAADRLLPTVRSRCLPIRLGLPDARAATAWLTGAGVADAAVLLAAANGRPQEALAMAADGIDAANWLALPLRVRTGRPEAMLEWPLPRAVEALLMLCHDLQRTALGAAPRCFPADRLPAGARPAALQRWAQQLLAVARHAEHPVNMSLVIEDLVDAGRQAFAAPVH
jgi:DNA polymerase-3 subunit delta'